MALKFLPSEIRGDASALDDLRRETARSHKLSHPNIVRIHDLHEDADGTAFIVMEDIDGQTLAALRLEQPARVLAWDYLRPLVAQLCAALEYAHGEKVIHRDLKPANIMVDSRGRLKLADFGIAAVASDSMSRVSVKYSTSGTLPYMSPQQVTGQRPQATDDIYALGATLYELLTSQLPFHTGDLTHQVLHVAPEPMEERLVALGIQNDVPPDAAAFIMACLAKEPGQRPQRARVVAEWIGIELVVKPSTESPAAAAGEPAGEGLSTSAGDGEPPISPGMLEAGKGGSRSAGYGRKLAAVGIVLLVMAGGFWLCKAILRRDHSNPPVAAKVLAPTTGKGAEQTLSTATPALKDAYQAHFYVGAAINRTIAMSAAVRADNANRNLGQVIKDIALVKEQFNQISPENDLKWQLIQPRPGPDGYDFGPADAYVNFGLNNHLYIVGLTLVGHVQTPDWVFQGTNTPAGARNATAGVAEVPGGGRGGRGSLSGPRATREELLQRMHDHIATVVGRYKGKIKVWDVVNEALSDGGTNILQNSLWTQIIGPDFIAKAFEYAHEADPDAILRYNDYSLENPAKRRKLITLIKSLQKQHVPVMAIGSQTHVSVTSPSFEQEDQALTELEALGLPIHITEFDVNGAAGGQRSTSGDVAGNAATMQGGLVDDANRRLAGAYAGLFRAFLKHDKSVKVVTFWGVNDGVSWRAQGRPLLFDADDQPKPAFNAVIRLVTGEQPKSQ